MNGAIRFFARQWRCCWMLLAAFFVGCGAAGVEPSNDGRIPVFAGIAPAAYLVEQIGGDHLKVDVLVGTNQDPHTFELTPQQVAELSRAKLFFKIGLPFEDAVAQKLQAGQLGVEIVDMARGVQKRSTGAACSHLQHDHHDHGVEGAPDPHIWLSPPLLKKQAENIAAALCRADPPHAEQYRENLAALNAKIDALDRRVRQMLAPYRGRAFYVQHPGFGYFADAYGLKEEAIEVGGREPAARQLHAIIQQAKTEGTTTIFTQPQYAPRGAQLVAEAIGGKVVLIDGLRKDVLADIEDIAAKIQKAFQENSQTRGLVQFSAKLLCLMEPPSAENLDLTPSRITHDR